MSASTALKTLMDGNARFVSGNTNAPATLQEITQLVGGQSPFATILGCSDSRVPVETVFDHQPGDIFVVRLAGNVASEEAIASIEFAVAILKSPLVVVLGHTGCGAVTGALEYVNTGRRLPGHMGSLLEAIAPAAQKTRSERGDWLRNAVVENVRNTVRRLKDSSPLLADAACGNGLEILGAVYDLSNGKVTLV